MVMRLAAGWMVLTAAMLMTACQSEAPAVESASAQAPEPNQAPPPQPVVIAVQPEDLPVLQTKVLNKAALAKLIGNSGLTLQWISWDTRGKMYVGEDRGEYWIEGKQETQDGKGSVYVDGRVTEIGSDYFLMEGEISIIGTPDKERVCKRVKPWRFAVTQGRKYWRLREFEWCDGLTDYIDIYF